jgi:hypothetical protein
MKLLFYDVGIILALSWQNHLNFAVGLFAEFELEQIYKERNDVFAD